MLLLALAALALVPARPRAQGVPLEFAVKAAYLYKFTPFVTWPSSAFPAPASPFNLCVAGDDPFGGALEEAVRGQAVGDHPIAVRHIEAGRIDAGRLEGDCHMLFAAGAGARLRGLAGRPILTVTDDGRAAEGGIVRFVMRDGRVRFDIDARAAQAAGLSVSSKLLGLAVSRQRTQP